MIDEREVRRIYYLAHLKLNDQDVKVIAEKYNKVLDFARSIMEVDTSHISNMEQVFDYKSDLREDVVGDSIDRELALKNAKSTEYGYFKIKRVVDKEEL